MVIMHMEESVRIELSGQLAQIYAVLVKEPEDKLPFEGIDIVKLLSTVPLFSRFFDTSSENFINLCVSQDAVTLPSGTFVYELEKNTSERFIYVILEGEVESSGS